MYARVFFLRIEWIFGWGLHDPDGDGSAEKVLHRPVSAWSRLQRQKQTRVWQITARRTSGLPGMCRVGVSGQRATWCDSMMSQSLASSICRGKHVLAKAEADTGFPTRTCATAMEVERIALHPNGIRSIRRIETSPVCTKCGSRMTLSHVRLHCRVSTPFERHTFVCTVCGHSQTCTMGCASRPEA
jgi:hypothetical protein